MLGMLEAPLPEVEMNQLDQLLADNAPLTSAEVPRVRSSIRALSASAEASARARGQGALPFGRRRVTNGIVAAALVLAGAGAAAAASSDWWGGQGEPELVLEGAAGLTDDCLAGFRITPGSELADGDAVAAARVALQHVRAADLDLAATEREMVSGGLLLDETPEAERRQYVLSTAVHERIEAELAEQGFDKPGQWALLGHSECPGETP
jgi:hypothetical protein